MRFRSFLTVLLGVSIAGSAVVYVQHFIKTPSAQQAMRDVVVVVEDVSFGEVMSADMLAVQSWPAHAVPNGAFSSVNQVISEAKGQERRAKLPLAKGDILFSSKISDYGELVSITQQIDPSMRAMTIRVDDVTGVAGLIVPADRIDLTLTRNVDQKLRTSTLLQDVEVLGIDQQGEGANRRAGNVKTVTVQVSPRDAQKLALAQQAGTLSLSLRHIDAADRLALQSISVDDLAETAKAAPKRVKSHQPAIVVIRRGERSTVEVPSG